MAHTLLAAAFVVTTAVTGYAAPTPAPTSPPGPVAVTECGQTVTSDAYLAKNLLCPTGVAVVLDGEGVDLDLNGRVLRGTRGSDGVIGTGRQSHTISHGTIQGFGRAISATEEWNSATGGTTAVDDVTLRDNAVGIEMFFNSAFVSGGRLVNNDIGATSFYGFVNFTGGSVFRENGTAVFGVISATNATFTRNDTVAACSDGALTISDSRVTHNAEVFGSTYMCAPTLERSYVAHNDLVLPVEHYHSGTAYVTENEFVGNGVVIDAYGKVEATGNTFVRNDVAVRSPEVGVPAENPDWWWAHVILTNNLFLRNGDAIDVLSPGVLTGNRVERSTGWGIHAPVVTDGGGNTARGNGREPQCTGVVCG